MSSGDPNSGPALAGASVKGTPYLLNVVYGVCVYAEFCFKPLREKVEWGKGWVKEWVRYLGSYVGKPSNTNSVYRTPHPSSMLSFVFSIFLLGYSAQAENSLSAI